MKILFIEDEHKIANSVKQGLEQEGFAVDLAFDGELGYDLALVEEYDLIILDLMLPKMDGISVCKNLRKKNIHTPIIMLTAKSEINERILGLNAGADDYLTKPFAFTELLARIRALLRRPNQLLPDLLICDDLQINAQNYTAKRGNKNIYLSKKEFALLEYLIRNKNNVISKEKIIEHVWNFESDILPNTVEVYIGYLRNKIDKPFESKPNLVKTVRGFGYKIEEPAK